MSDTLPDGVTVLLDVKIPDDERREEFLQRLTDLCDEYGVVTDVRISQ